ncbi:hypothetical protein E2C01_011876 [Portunus trituberculatus]|uniref:Uncharacterized protein n=1 Tax=Portunus trituberculatus TaxID=210409 RepID=A0A5B7DCI0_PORTR|nr:hypothetical protein [Portunus trituberculatus]
MTHARVDTRSSDSTPDARRSASVSVSKQERLGELCWCRTTATRDLQEGSGPDSAIAHRDKQMAAAVHTSHGCRI